MPHLRRTRFLAPALVLVLVLGAFGCGSARKRGLEHLEKGEFDAATSELEKAVAQDPKDEEAKAALTKAREGVLGARLISVRKARMGGNIEAAQLELLEVYKLQEKLKVYPTGAAAFTQEEETNFAVDAMKGQVRTLLAAKKPLAAAWMVNRFGVFLQGSRKPAQAELASAVTASGKAACKEMVAERAGAELHYLDSFLARFCGYFGEQPKLKVAKPTLAPELLGKLAIQQNVPAGGAAAPESVRSRVETELVEAFRASPWYLAEATATVPVALTVEYQESRTKNGVVLSKSYVESEPYQDVETVTKERQIPYVENGVTRFRAEKYTESVPVVRHRDVEKSYRYPAWKHEQKLGLKVHGTAQLAALEIPLALEQSSAAEGIEHDETHKASGLKPERPNLPEPPKWVEEHAKKLAAGFGARAAEHWRASFCTAPPSARMAAGNHVFRCLRGSPAGTVPDVVQAWHKEQLGLTVEQAREVLGG